LVNRHQENPPRSFLDLNGHLGVECITHQ